MTFKDKAFVRADRGADLVEVMVSDLSASGMTWLINLTPEAARTLAADLLRAADVATPAEEGMRLGAELQRTPHRPCGSDDYRKGAP